MPVLHTDVRALTLRFELHEQPESVVQELVEEVGEDADLFPYTIQTFVEVDGEKLGVISSVEVQVDTHTMIPRVCVKVAEGLTVSDFGRTIASEDLRNSIRNTVEKLLAFRFVEVSSPYTERHEPEHPPGLTVWERLMSDDE